MFAVIHNISRGKRDIAYFDGQSKALDAFNNTKCKGGFLVLVDTPNKKACENRVFIVLERKDLEDV